jgi:hypothetical protein
MPFPKNNSLGIKHEIAKQRRKIAERDLQVAKDELVARRLEEAELQEEYAKSWENEPQGSCDDDEEAQAETAASSRLRPSVVAVVKATEDDAAARRKKAQAMGQSMLACDLTDFLGK